MCSFQTIQLKNITGFVLISLILWSSLHFWTAPSSKGACKAKSLTVDCPTMALSLLYRTLWALQYPSSSLCSGLHRHLVADICTEQRGQLELQPKFWLCSCQLERERHGDSQVCLLQFSPQSKNNHWCTHLWYYVMLHYFGFSHIFQRWTAAQSHDDT